MVITLLTDFGTSDTYVAQMKGVLAQMAPQARVVDLTHAISPQSVLEGAIHLDAAVDAFADDTIHVAVVDPGVGSERRGLALRCACGTFVGPDNGLFTAVLERYPLKAAVSLEDEALFRQPVSPTFHGRDIFAPIAAHLANGLHLTEFGPAVDDLVKLDLPKPEVSPADQGVYIKAHVLLADHFGNLITDLRRETFDAWLAGRPMHEVYLELPNAAPLTIQRTFTDAEPGQPVAYFGSSGRLELAVRNGSADETIGMASSPELSVKLQ